MAKIDNLLAEGQGGLGELVLYRMNGKVYARTKPAKYRDKKSPAQLAQRQRLQVVNAFLRPFRELIKVTFASEAIGRSALQAAQSYIMRNAVAGAYPNIYVDKSKVLLSKGPLPPPAGASVEAHPDGLLVKWKNGKEASGNAASDTLLVIAWSEENGGFDYQFTGVRRSEGAYVWKTRLAENNVSMPVVWVVFQNARQTKLSDSLMATS